jgi:phenylacetate-coenzyme A ligase PaaK-like adenylate-forming protein
MTTATITDLELLKTRISGAVGRRMPEHIARLGWDAGRLAACQRDRLRALLARAIAGSPFHAERLRGIDPDRFELADLARLPVMTKADMMENFDAATNDRRLTRDLVERHLARAVTDPGLVGHSEPGSTVLTFASDTCIAECTDDEGRPVPDGVASAKVLVTNLHNLTQPIIRYELTDRFTPAGTSEGGALRASVEGRSDDLFRYAEASVHPFVIGAPLLHAPAVREFQVRQTERGADITAVIDGDFDSAALTTQVARSLRQAGLTRPQVGFRRVGVLDRDPMTSKCRRFIPLSVR